MKFTIEETPTIMHGLVVRHNIGQFEISSSRNKISISGFLDITTSESLKLLKKELDLTFKEYLKIRN